MNNTQEKRVLVVMKNGGFLRYFGSTILELSKTASVYVGFEDPLTSDPDGSIAEFTAQVPDIHILAIPSRKMPFLGFFHIVRVIQDQIRFIHPAFDSAPGLWKGRTGVSTKFQVLNSILRLLPSFLRLALVRFEQQAARAVQYLRPVSLHQQAMLRDIDPDLVIFTGLVWHSTGQTNLLLTAKSLSIPTAYYVNSWDNLSNKGDIKAVPDWIFVWNETQKKRSFIYTRNW